VLLREKEWSSLIYDQYADAEKYSIIALEVQQAHPSSPDLDRTLFGLAQFYTGQGKHVDAERLFKNALTIQERAIPGYPDFAKKWDAAERRSRAGRIGAKPRQKETG
jgi:Tetratricopeptide repeat